ncbi:hypothetical protein NKR23_g9478 [Pleurostoma richardsiae]|uniref:Uncharacterized protein n=1 Tax=Pleurostoma richardsiae TaxID=41990 RepID=A0AA38RCG5_9PEZI|nr:hypothetical protein NKR23_g9478 [Pleurostoma richardsiae]
MIGGRWNKTVRQDYGDLQLFEGSDNTAVLHSIQTFIFKACKHEIYHYQIPAVLLGLWQSMPRLEEIALLMSCCSSPLITSTLRSCLEYSPVSLPNLKVLWLGNFLDAKVRLSGLEVMTPNLEVVRLPGQFFLSSADLYRAFAELPSLKWFIMDKSAENPCDRDPFASSAWSAEDTQDFGDIISNVRQLIIRGNFDLGDYLETPLTPEIAEHFAELPNLEELHITDEMLIYMDDLSRNFHLAIDSDDESEDYYDHEEEYDKMMEEVLDLVWPATFRKCRTEVADIFFEKCPKLRRLAICNSHCGTGIVFEAERDEDGQVIDVQAVSDDITKGQIQWDHEGWPLVTRLQLRNL